MSYILNIHTIYRRLGRLGITFKKKRLPYRSEVHKLMNSIQISEVFSSY